MSALSPPERFMLEQWGRQLHEAFAHRAYFVGSALYGREDGRAYRDVDVRLLLPADEFDRLTAGDDGRLRALNLSVSLWGRQVTGLPIDFQFQEIEAANAEFSGGGKRHYRSAMGIVASGPSKPARRA